MWEDVARIIRDNKKFVLTTHIHPEGDAIGAEIALGAFLQDFGKEVTIVNSSATPQNSVFMDPQGAIKIYPDDYTPEILETADVVFIVDVNNWSHLGPFADALRQSETPRVNIDHHQGNEEGFAAVTVSDTTAAAAGLLIYELIRYMEGEITPCIAEAVYAALITDTGTFRFSNTDDRVFRAATELYGLGVKPFQLHRQVFGKTRAAVGLLGAVLSTMDSTPDGQIAWIHVTREMLEKTGADYEDSDGILDVVRSIGDVEYCLFFKELRDGGVKISLRSNGKVDVYKIAKEFGGGGHRMASGMSVDGPLSQAIRNVIDVCKEKHAVSS